MRSALDVIGGPSELREAAIAASHAARWREATRAWRGVVAASPEDTDAQLRLGLALHSDRRLDEAERVYRRALLCADAADQPDVASLLQRWLGKVLLQSGRADEARDLLRPVRRESRTAHHMYLSATAQWLTRVADRGFGQESILDVADHTLEWFDGLPADDTAARIVAGRPRRRARPPFHLSGLEGGVVRPEYALPPLYLACYRDAVLLSDGSVITRRGNLVAETLYVDGHDPAVGLRRRIHRKAQLELTADGRVRGVAVGRDLVECPHPVLSIKTRRSAYGAWLTTQLPRFFARDWIDVPDLHFHLRRNRDFGAEPLMEPLGIPGDRIVESTKGAFHGSDSRAGPAMHCDYVFVSNYPMFEYGWMVPESMGPIRAIRDHFAGPAPRPRRRIYVSRSDVAFRVLENDSEVYERLRPLGFEFIVPSRLSWRDKVRAFADAEIVVGPNGSGLYNCLFSGVPGSHLIVLLDGFDDPRTIFIVPELIGANASYIRAVGAWSAASLGARTAAFRIEPERVLEAVAKAVDDLAGRT